jgi:hypothetical protein
MEYIICLENHMEKIIKITDQKIISKLIKILDEKAHIHQKIREGKISEIKSAIRFVKPL